MIAALGIVGIEAGRPSNRFGNLESAQIGENENDVSINFEPLLASGRHDESVCLKDIAKVSSKRLQNAVTPPLMGL
jgi:hypothetical protein